MLSVFHDRGDLHLLLKGRDTMIYISSIIGYLTLTMENTLISILLGEHYYA